MSKYGIDVSRYNGTIDWNKVKADGVQFAILKTVSTNNSFGGIYIDQQFERNYAECKRLGIPVGVYYYTYATQESTVRAELAMLKKALAGKTFEYPIWIDAEDKSIVRKGKQQLTDMLILAAKEIESWGYYVGYYSYTSFLKSYVDYKRLKHLDCWIAQYGSNKGVKPWERSTWSEPHGIWQYTSTGKVNGITGNNGNVDLNESYKDYPSIMKKYGLNGFAKDNNVSVPKEEVIKPVEKVMKVGARVLYSGNLYGDSFGGLRGKKVSGEYTVTRYIAGRKCGVHLNGLGWVAEKDCVLI